MSRILRIVAIGVIILATTGCDSAARETLLQGAESAVSTLGTSLIHALFESIGDPQDDHPVNTVKHKVFPPHRRLRDSA